MKISLEVKKCGIELRSPPQSKTVIRNAMKYFVWCTCWTLCALLSGLQQRVAFVGAVDSSGVGDIGAVTSAPGSDRCPADFWPRQLDEMDGYIDDSVRPCDDFHEYACGNWRVPYSLRSLRAHDTLTAVKADNKRQLMAYLQAVAEGGSNQKQPMPAGGQALVRIYNACLGRVVGGRDPSDKDPNGLKVYTDALRRFSDWPVLNPYFLAANANASFNWEYVSAELGRYGVQSLWQLQVQPNWQAAEQQIVYITAHAFDLLKPTKAAEKYDSDSVFLYKRYVKYLMLDLGVRVRRALRIADEVVEFEKQLMALVGNGRLLLLREPQSLAALQRQLPQIAWAKYFDTLLQDVQALPPDYAQRLLVVADVPYLRQLAALLQRTKADVIGKYLLVQFLAHFEVRLHDEDSYQEQRENCLHQLHSFLPVELAQIFLKLQHANNSDEYLLETQTALNEIFARLKLQFEQMLNATNVFERDALSKVLGLEKLRAMRLLLPHATTTPNALPADLNITDNYDENLMLLWRWRTNRQLHDIRQSLTAAENLAAPAPSYSSYGPLDVNAYYRLKKNAIELPVGMLRTPFYHACLQPARIYGSFVYVIAHELLHGFDYDGLNYDKSGNMASNWGVKAIIKFGTKSSCYLSGRYSNAALTVNENIADSEGLRLALEAWKHQRLAAGENGTLPVQQLKLFFLSFAQTWCGASAAANGNSLHGGHRERVNNAVSNFPEFAAAFRCEDESDMNPEEKCRIW